MRYLISPVVDFLHCIKIPDYTISSIKLKYVQKKQPVEKRKGVWNKEQYYWTNEGSTHYVHYPRKDYETRQSDWLPDNTLFIIKYWYNNRKYVYMTRDKNHSWPPAEPKDVKFRLPIIKVVIVKNDNTIECITKKFKKAAGPYGNFFNQPVTPYDIIDIVEFQCMVMVNVMNMTYKFNNDEIIQLP